LLCAEEAEEVLPLAEAVVVEDAEAAAEAAAEAEAGVARRYVALEMITK
jgi:hypothetical protein